MWQRDKLYPYYIILSSLSHYGLYLVFLVVKLTAASDNLILRRHFSLYLDPVIIGSEDEWKVKKVLNSY